MTTFTPLVTPHPTTISPLQPEIDNVEEDAEGTFREVGSGGRIVKVLK